MIVLLILLVRATHLIGTNRTAAKEGWWWFLLL